MKKKHIPGLRVSVFLSKADLDKNKHSRVMMENLIRANVEACETQIRESLKETGHLKS